MKWSIKRDLVFLLIAVMTIGSLTVSAEELGERAVIDAGSVEANINTIKTDVYQVDMPIDTEGIFDFILDPMGLINKTDAAAYNGKTFEKNSTMFFKRSDENAIEDYSNKSDSITIINKSSVAIDICVEVKIEESSIQGLTMAEDREFKNNPNANLYLALSDGEQIIPVGEDGISVNVTVDAAPDGAYEYVYNSDTREYTYKLKNDLSGIEFSKFSFQLIGAANGKADWTKMTKAAPKIDVTWRVEPKIENVVRKDAILCSQNILSMNENNSPDENDALNEDDTSEMNIMLEESGTEKEELESKEEISDMEEIENLNPNSKQEE